ncbi:HlyD family efflux transporter periplasmic adaptor subunit [Massilia arenosa]|uniref:HlyD family efflux transporter periplasmic adaptor subunit n=1 Tax=Zemynaea arenosa TaxID=2561931 RepID=A0A4Y9S676_9BURK|nr:HlyD family efflux transporter periplasmic adaptor subunit [Massilia arenosa]TFW16998.1 HlyD family efflux transporter periplasmic adaptor subunit [Massilia arenosa]
MTVSRTLKTSISAPLRPDLYRSQAIGHAVGAQYGTVVLAQNVTHTVLAALFAASGLALIAFFFFFGATRKVQCSGHLIPTVGVLKVVPVQGGVVVESRVREGQEVKRGEVLFALSSERSTSSDDSTQQTVSRLLRERRISYDTELKQSHVQAAQRIAAAERRVRSLDAEQLHLDKEIDLQTRRVNLAEESQQRYAQLRETHFISKAQYQEREVDLLDQRQRLTELQRLRSAGQRDLASAVAERNDMVFQFKRDAAAIERNVSQVAQDLAENEARREILVRAPRDGMVTAITAEAGQTVGAGTLLASVLPAGAALEGEIYAPSRAAGFVRPGMRVLLRYEAYPYQKFGQHLATVREVASTALRPDELNLPSGATGGEPLYRIRVQLDSQSVRAYGKALPLKSGMLVDASIMLERRRLYEWILEPLLSVSGRL